jgi:hypothetical protein
LFLDYNVGNKVVPQALALAGINFEYHTKYFDGAAEDPTWIRFCGEKDWPIVTKDKRLETDPVNRQAVIDAQARVFILDEGGVRGIVWASALIVSRDRIYDIVRAHKGPFFSTVKRETLSLVSLPRFA